MNQFSGTTHQADKAVEARARVTAAVARLAEGGGVIVVDDESRENEGDLIFAAESITPEQMNLLIRHGSGIVCLVIDDELAQALDLPPMVTDNTSRNRTAFTVSIEAREGVTTGVSAADRVRTIRQAVTPGCRPEDLARPGHVFPLRAHPGGLRARRGHTEATLELATMAGKPAGGVLCEIMNPDGTMARLPELRAFAERHGFPMVSVEDLVTCLGERSAAA